MNAATIPAQRSFCVGCGSPVSNLLTDTCGTAACVAVSNDLDALEACDVD